MNNYTSIAHWPNLTTHGEYLVGQNKMPDGRHWVWLYKGVPERCEFVATYLQKKRFLVHDITGRRFGSIERMVAHYAKGGRS